MYDDMKPRLQLVADNTEAKIPLAELVAQYSAEIDQRRQQLADELTHFEQKLGDLKQLDPLDFTGLAKIYRGHADHIRRLLSEFHPG